MNTSRKGGTARNKTTCTVQKACIAPIAVATLLLLRSSSNVRISTTANTLKRFDAIEVVTNGATTNEKSPSILVTVDTSGTAW